MNAQKQYVHRIKAKIKQLYKAYDEHLDHITKLDELLNTENSKVQACYHELEKYRQYLTLLEKRGKVFPAHQ